MAGSHKIEPEVHNGVSTLDEPSAAWGWHNIGRGAIQIAGWISVAFLLGMNVGNHRGHVETIWLCSIAALIAIGLLIQLFQPKLSQVRTVTAHNKPAGHVEPNWTYDQLTLTGTHANLTEGQLRAQNIDPKMVKRELA